MTGAGTSRHVDPRRVWRAARTPVAIAVLVVVAAVLLTMLVDRTSRGPLDPAGVAPAGSRAVAELLRDNGVTVDVVRTSADIDRAGDGTSVLVPFPQRLADTQVEALRRSSSDIVLVAPDQDVLTALAPGVRLTALNEPVDVRAPDCLLRSAVSAGPVDLGGRLYRGDDAVGCYPTDGGNALLQRTSGGRTVTVLGSSDILTNEALAREGNAALALSLLGTVPRLLWFLPTDEDTAADPRDGELIPAGWAWGAAQLCIAAVIVMLWRARRLGPVVTEPLPVVVRSAEAVEGRARLYRRAGARAHAADVLRYAATARMAPMLGLPDVPRHAGAPDHALVAGIAQRTGRPGGEVHSLLYGPSPVDDAALIMLADTLDACEAEVRRA